MNTDPVADMLTRIRNANLIGHSTVVLPFSKLKLEIARLLKSEGFIESFKETLIGKFKYLEVTLKYTNEKDPVITGLKRVSKPGLRVYSKAKKMPKVYNGLGIVIVSTHKGLMTDRRARAEKVGGEILCYVW